MTPYTQITIAVVLMFFTKSWLLLSTKLFWNNLYGLFYLYIILGWLSGLSPHLGFFMLWRGSLKSTVVFGTQCPTLGVLVSEHWYVFSLPFCCFTSITKLDYSLPCILTLKMNQLVRIVATRMKVLLTSTESSPRKCSCSDHWASQMVFNYKTENFKAYNLAICSVSCPIWHKYHLRLAYKVQKLNLVKLSWFLKIWIQGQPEQSTLWKDGNWEALSIKIAGSQRGSPHGDTVEMDPYQ